MPLLILDPFKAPTNMTPEKGKMYHMAKILSSYSIILTGVFLVRTHTLRSGSVQGYSVFEKHIEKA